MKYFKNSILSIFAAGILLLGCESAEDSLINDRLNDNPLPTPPSYTAGSGDFSKYVSVGNSLTAGLMDGALYTMGQNYSFPNLLASSLIEVSGGSFNQPNVNSENGFNSALSNVSQGLIFGRTELDVSIPGPVPTPGEFPIPPFNGNKAALNNFGVPGIKVANLFTSDLLSNPALGLYYARFASNPGSSSIIQDAVAANPTFFSLWIGNNDVLQYAISGGLSESMITSNGDFQQNFTNALGSLTQTGADGVVLNIPPLTVLPFFRAISYNAIGLSDVEAQQLSAGFQAVNTAYQALVNNLGHSQADADRRKVSYSAGANPILVIDETLEDLGPKFDILLGAGAITPQQRQQLVPYEQSRPLTAGELVLITAGRVLGTDAAGPNTPIGVVIPLGFDIATGNLQGDQYYLTIAEQTNIVTARATYNAIISGVVNGVNQQGANVQLVDTHPVMADLFGLNAQQASLLALTSAGVSAADGVRGIDIAGVTIQPDFSPNGFFSTDGIHPNPRGHAMIANEIIKVLESAYNANLPEVDVLNYPSVIIAQ